MALAFYGDGVHRSGCSGDAVAFSKALVVVATTFGLGHDIRTHIQAHTHTCQSHWLASNSISASSVIKGTATPTGTTQMHHHQHNHRHNPLSSCRAPAYLVVPSPPGATTKCVT